MPAALSGGRSILAQKTETQNPRTQSFVITAVSLLLPMEKHLGNTAPTTATFKQDSEVTADDRGTL